jgi:pyruvate formate lyase activating enzyme
MRKIDWGKCNQCLECAKVCPSGAIEIVGNYMSVEETMTEIEKDWLFYLNSGGGVTFSGGEPLYQWEFVRDVAKQCRQKGIHTALDTTGYARWETLEQVLEYIDLVLYDIKHLDSRIHQEGTGIGNELILANAAKTAARVRTWLRVPLIPGFNDSEDHIIKVAQLGMQLGVEKMSLLPYHQWGESKYARLGRDYPFKGVEPPPKEYVNRLSDLVESCQLEVAVGG